MTKNTSTSVKYTGCLPHIWDDIAMISERVFALNSSVVQGLMSYILLFK